MTKEQKIKSLKNKLEKLYLEMPSSFFEQEQRNKSAFLITKELEILENFKSYIENKNHWDSHEIRL